MTWSRYLPLSLLLLLLLLQLPKNSARTFVHFGICRTREYGVGKCVTRDTCEFEQKDQLNEDRAQCGVQLSRELICCPNVNNAKPKPQRPTSIVIARDTVVVVPAVPAVKALTGDTLPRAPTCGVELGGRIFGGKETKLLEYPWLALLEYTLAPGEFVHSCGGSFIAQRWVLTAAHCVVPYFLGDGKKLTGVRLGEWDKSTDPDCYTHPSGKKDCTEKHIDVPVDRILPHADFNVRSYSHDIALLRLERAIDWTKHEHILPICLPLDASVRENRLPNEIVNIAGWGRTEFSRHGSDIKLKAELTVTPLSVCQPKYRMVNYSIDDTQICASGQMGVDSCQGDSGGPLMSIAYPSSGVVYTYAAGIVSFGQIACGLNNFPSIYTRVGAFTDWIEQTIGQNV